MLIKKTYYLLQKAKVSLGQYESAMTGFQQIINQNPFSYEGLTASWDYSATSLLDSIHGTGGGGSSKNELQMSNNENEVEDKSKNFTFFIDDPIDFSNNRSKSDDKKNPFTKEEKKVIKENIVKSFNTSREKEFEIVKELQNKIEEGKATKKDKTEFQKKKILSETVKAKKPHNIQEHISFVNSDIRKIFRTEKSENFSDSPKELIPTEYNLSQNYPNPFNPVTKINFSLPQDSKVKLIIYEILGKEVKRLVNNEFKTAGVYTMDFNGSGLSSGVYFYKIEAGKFVQTKRMVLLK
ncbi:MAG: T9SS type A sorting domain-containing protein [Ignavibacteria bacterium]|nr:T9SS type A sorting domain-containing protein [Ignavibacteria bacterium]